jgi:hypothetical protein
MIALRRDEPHWLLNDGDAKVYGQAVSNALRHVPIKVAQKSLDFGMLFIVACQFEFPRIVLSTQMTRARGQRRSPGGPAQVFQFTRPPPPPPASPPGGASPHVPGGEVPLNGSAAASPDMTYEPEPDTPTVGP